MLPVAMHAVARPQTHHLRADGGHDRRVGRELGGGGLAGLGEAGAGGHVPGAGVAGGVGATSGVVAVRWTAVGTHRAAYLGAAPTGGRITFKGIEIIRVRGGLIIERWGEWDGLALLEQIVDFTAHHTDMDHVTVERQFAAELPPTWVDKDQIRQVAVNLMLNAGAAMAEGGTLTVRTALGADGRVYLSFEDNGAGIPEENLQKIFEPFFTTKARGTGLGLAITKTIIDQHRGTIAIASEVGRGTTVTVGLVTDPRLADGSSKPAYFADRR